MIATVGVTPTNWNEMLVHPVFNVGKGMPLEVDKPSPYPSHKSYRKYMEDLLLYPENLGAHQYHSVDEFVLRALQAIQEAPISNPCWDGLVTSFESLHSQMIVKKPTANCRHQWDQGPVAYCSRGFENTATSSGGTVKALFIGALGDIAADKSAIKPPKQGWGPKKAFPRGGPQVALGIRTRRQQWPTKVEARNVPGQWLMRGPAGVGHRRVLVERAALSRSRKEGRASRTPACSSSRVSSNLAAAAYLLVGARGLSAVDAEVTVVTQTRRKRSAGASIRGSQWVVRLCVWGNTSYFNVTPEKAIRIVSLLPFGLVTDGIPVAMMVEEVLRAKEMIRLMVSDEGEQIPRVAINWPPKPGMAVVYPCRIKDAAKLTKVANSAILPLSSSTRLSTGSSPLESGAEAIKATGVSLSGTEGKDDKTLGEVEKDKRRTEMVDLAKKVVTEGRGMRRVLKRGGSWGWKVKKLSVYKKIGASVRIEEGASINMRGAPGHTRKLVGLVPRLPVKIFGLTFCIQAFIIDDTVDPKPPFGLLLGQPFIDLAGAKTVWTEVGNQWTRFPSQQDPERHPEC
ncbi:hypothetical protein BC829DRAFT_422042 [Chytridium lagenaria]|nr:hypothetical protein BC829DRAFT_422042 [Chytridium lagenaria]